MKVKTNPLKPVIIAFSLVAIVFFIDVPFESKRVIGKPYSASYGSMHTSAKNVSVSSRYVEVYDNEGNIYRSLDFDKPLNEGAFVIVINKSLISRRETYKVINDMSGFINRM